MVLFEPSIILIKLKKVRLAGLHDKRHFKKMGSAEIEAFLTHLAVEEHIAASTQNQTENAVVFRAGFHERAF